MRHTLPTAPQFYVTAPQPCPYLDGNVERKLFTALYGDDSKSLNDSLSQQGFRRSQNVLYRPTCPGCSACMSARVISAEFEPSRSQRRILKRNSALTRDVKAPWATEDHFELFGKYLDQRHPNGGMAGMNMSEFAALIEETPVQSRVIEYYEEGDEGTQILVAACLTDVLNDGLSMVYSFFNPSLKNRSIGAFIILDHISMARQEGLPYVYLGYWVPGSQKMSYKANYRPLEVFKGGAWTPLSDTIMADVSDNPLGNYPVAEQVAAIHLPPQL
ncbi:MAG: arginyltransferase [Paracoccaceae bacterium]